MFNFQPKKRSLIKKRINIFLVIVFLLLFLLSFEALADKKTEVKEWFNKAFDTDSITLKIKYYTKVIELDPKYVKAYFNRGWAYGKLGQYQKAINSYDKAIELDPKFVKAYYNRGLAYRKSGEYQKAINNYDKVLELDPEFKNAYTNREIAYEKLEELKNKGPAGGEIFYDKGSYSGGWRYLEAAPASTEWSKKDWGSYRYYIEGTAIGIGTGKSNTAKIATWLNDNDRWSLKDHAAQLCDALDYGGYSDWFLPSKDELNLMYKNLKVKGVGGFADDYYWSSSEKNTGSAWLQDFSNGKQRSYQKSNFSNRVRAVRAF